MKLGSYILLSCLAAGTLSSCREEYVPPAIGIDYNYLVIEGFINTSADSSFFTLSRTQPPGQSTAVGRETGATLEILLQDGSTYSSSVNKGNGIYGLRSPGAATSASYQLKVQTPDGKSFLSDPVTPKNTPEIDEVGWVYDSVAARIDFNVSTHDNTSQSKYYRWEYEETWEYRANYNTNLEYNGTEIVTRPAENSVYTCWSTRKSTDILIATSAALSQDVISKAPIYSFARGGNKFNVRNSLLVKQYVLTEKAYNYWLNLQKMTETGGSIFDAQPTELVGNFRCISNPDEPVIGYLSASSVTTQRIFVTRDEVRALTVPFPFQCEERQIQMTANALFGLFGSGTWLPVYYGDGPNTVVGANRECADCTFYGGTTTKPTFW